MIASYALSLAALAWLLAATPREPAPLAGDEAERFLAAAEIVGEERLGVGVTGPRALTLELGGRRARALFKTVDQHRPVARFADGTAQADFRDSYRAEIAAYELDELLGLGMVPPTVERRWGAETGSLQLWVEGAISEKERMERGLEPPDVSAWNRQMHTVRLFHQLIYDSDRGNARNLLVDASFRIRIIDSSRAFHVHDRLPSPDSLIRFSRRVLAALGTLDRETLRSRLGRWLSGHQIDALLARRDRILERAEELVAQRGEAAVLYP